MSFIQAVIGGKKKGLADQVTIDPALGCANQCVGCYAKKSCQRGKHYDTVVPRNLDKEILKKSIRTVKAQGFNFARVGKHCDPGDHIDSLYSIVDCCTDESIRCIIVSKSLNYYRQLAEKMEAGNHVLHVSLGPYTPIAKSEAFRVRAAQDYIDAGVRTAIRLTRDITQDMQEIDKYVTSTFDYIVTPMRYASRELMNFYKADEVNFEFTSGYFRPKIISESWTDFMTNVCGEINNEIKCCNCLVN